MAQAKIITVTMNPALDQTILLETFHPGQLNRISSARLDPGGKGINVAKSIRALQHPVSVTGFLGLGNAAPFLQLFQEQDITESFLRLAGENRVNIKLIENKPQQVSELNLPGIQPDKTHLADLLEKLQTMVAAGDWVILAGSLPSSLPDDSYEKMISALKPLGCRILLDSSSTALRLGLRAKPYCAKPNLPEISQLTGLAVDGKADWLRAVDRLLDDGLELAALSLGSHGALLGNTAEVWFAPALKIPVASTVGAGDAFVAGLIVAQANNESLSGSLALATAAAAASVAMPGTQAGTSDAVKELLSKVVLEKWR